MEQPPQPPHVLTFPPPIPPPPQDIIPKIFPAGKVTFLSGATGAGKTAWYAGFLAQLFSSQLLYGYQLRRPAYVGVILADRSWDSHRLWLDLAGVPDIPHYSIVDDYAFNTARLKKRWERATLLQCLIEGMVPEPPYDSLILVDPLALFLGGQLLDYDTSAVALIELGRLCRRRGWTILGMLHTAKLKADPRERYVRPQDRALGSTALAAFAASTFHLATQEETGEDWAELSLVSHHAAPRVVRLLRRAQDGLWEEAPAVMPTRHERMALEQQERLLDAFPQDGTAISSTQLLAFAKANLRLKRARVYAILAQLAMDGRVAEGEERGTWVLKPKS